MVTPVAPQRLVEETHSHHQPILELVYQTKQLLTEHAQNLTSDQTRKLQQLSSDLQARLEKVDA